MCQCFAPHREWCSFYVPKSKDQKHSNSETMRNATARTTTTTTTMAKAKAYCSEASSWFMKSICCLAILDRNTRCFELLRKSIKNAFFLFSFLSALSLALSSSAKRYSQSACIIIIVIIKVCVRLCIFEEGKRRTDEEVKSSAEEKETERKNPNEKTMSFRFLFFDFVRWLVCFVVFFCFNAPGLCNWSHKNL